jgi:hypothetical protein
LQGGNLHLGLLYLLLHISNVLKERQPLNLIRIGILLQGLILCLQIYNPLQAVASL